MFGFRMGEVCPAKFFRRRRRLISGQLNMGWSVMSSVHSLQKLGFGQVRIFSTRDAASSREPDILAAARLTAESRYFFLESNPEPYWQNHPKSRIGP